MKRAFEAELRNVSVKLNEWDRIVRSYVELTYGPEGNDAERVGASTKLHYIFEILLRLFTIFRDFKESWAFPAEIGIMPEGQCTRLRSKKTGIVFDFGIHYDDFYLHSPIDNPSCIKNMDDRFWSHFIALQSLGQFHFVENACPSGEEANRAEKLLRNTKSNIFQMIRNYILLELYEGTSTDMGMLEVVWPIETPWDVIIRNGASAFSEIYQINYMLYRASRTGQKGSKVGWR